MPRRRHPLVSLSWTSSRRRVPSPAEFESDSGPCEIGPRASLRRVLNEVTARVGLAENSAGAGRRIADVGVDALC